MFKDTDKVDKKYLQCISNNLVACKFVCLPVVLMVKKGCGPLILVFSFAL